MHLSGVQRLVWFQFPLDLIRELHSGIPCSEHLHCLLLCNNKPVILEPSSDYLRCPERGATVSQYKDNREE